MRTRLRAVGVACLVWATASCARGPVPVALGDACARCHMPVADARYGAELITRTGVIRKYDSIECLANDLLEEVVVAADVRSLWVVPFDAPGTLIPVEDAVFVRTDAQRSPMGMGLTAFGPDADRTAFAFSPDDRILTWDDVVDLVASETPSPVGYGTGHATH